MIIKGQMYLSIDDLKQLLEDHGDASGTTMPEIKDKSKMQIVEIKETQYIVLDIESDSQLC